MTMLLQLVMRLGLKAALTSCWFLSIRSFCNRQCLFDRSYLENWTFPNFVVWFCCSLNRVAFAACLSPKAVVLTGGSRGWNLRRLFSCLGATFYRQEDILGEVVLSRQVFPFEPFFTKTLQGFIDGSVELIGFDVLHCHSRLDQLLHWLVNWELFTLKWKISLHRLTTLIACIDILFFFGGLRTISVGVASQSPYRCYLALFCKLVVYFERCGLFFF